jgi:aminoglycoside 6'-N-acetyltransferase
MTEQSPLLRGAEVVLRPVTRDDLDDLARIRSTPEVHRWWGDVDGGDWAAWLADEGHRSWVVELDGATVGLAQWYEETEPEYRHAGLDLFLHPEVHGRGLGRDTVRTVVRWLVDERRHHRVIIDPDARNTPAIRCYRAVGFRPVGVLRRYWYDHVDQTWSDGLLLDLLADEIT